MWAITLYLCIIAFASAERNELNISTNVNDTRFFLYTSNDRNGNDQSRVELKLGDRDSMSRVRSNTNTYIIIDGFLSNGDSQMSLQTKTELLSSRPNSNVIIVDWGRLSGNGNSFETFGQTSGAYIKVLGNVGLVANATADLMWEMHTDRNISYRQMHIIGHSLGAHMAGAIGLRSRTQNSAEVGRISGLDPAGPMFSEQDNMRYRLDRSDATHVEIFHTNRGTLGDRARLTGDANIFVNGGRSQRRCEEQDKKGMKGWCSHSFSWQLFNYCVRNECRVCPCSGSDCECPDCNLRCSTKIMVGLNTNSDNNANGDLYFGQGSTNTNLDFKTGAGLLLRL